MMKKTVLSLILLFVFCGCVSQDNNHFQIENKLSNEAKWQYSVNMYNVKYFSIKLSCFKDGKLVDSIPLGGFSYKNKIEDKGKMIVEYSQSESKMKVPMIKMNTQIFTNNGDTKILSSNEDFTNQIAVLKNSNRIVSADDEFVLMNFVDKESYNKNISDPEKSTIGYSLIVEVRFD